MGFKEKYVVFWLKKNQKADTSVNYDWKTNNNKTQTKKTNKPTKNNNNKKKETNKTPLLKQANLYFWWQVHSFIAYSKVAKKIYFVCACFEETPGYALYHLSACINLSTSIRILKRCRSVEFSSL